MSKASFPRLRWLAYAVIAGALLALLSCSKDKPSEPDEPDQYVELSDTTEVLADTTLALLSSVEDSVLAFTRSNTQLDAVSVSDIIICGISDKTPYGFLGRGTHVSAGHDTLIVTRATLEEAIENCRINFSRELSPLDVDSTTSLKGVRTLKATDAYEFGLELDNVVLFDADGSENTTSDQVVANGAVNFNLRFDGQLEIKWFKLKYFLFKIDAEENVQLDIDARVNIIDVHNVKTLRTYYFGAFAIGPVIFTPKMDIRVGLDGEVSISATAVVTQTNTLEAGITYEHGDWSPISDFSASFNYDMPAVASEAAIKGWAGPQLSLLIYGVVGPYAEADAYLRLQADLLPQLAWALSWALYGGLEAKVGVEVDLLGHTLVDYHTTPIQYEKLLASDTISDTTSPAVITDLTTGDVTSNSITLYWTAPGDDGDTGTASEYDIRYSTSNITTEIWNSATQCTGEPSPNQAGSSESFTVTGLKSNTRYYFATKTADDSANWSDLSNVARDSTLSDSVVHFADPNLEAVIREKINKPSGDIYPSDVACIDSLNAGGRQIRFLDGIEWLVNLTWLALGGNQISNLYPLSGLTSLTWLNLGSNHIYFLYPLSDLTSLTYLQLSGNQINVLVPLSGLTSLEGLDLGFNHINDLGPLSGLTSLTMLELAWNQISDLSPLSGLTSLTMLDLRFNQTSDLSPLSGLTSLRKLYLVGSQISDLTPLSGLTSLSRLGLGCNQISDLAPLSSLTGLTLLILAYNQISDITPLSSLTSLTELKLYSNQISNLAPLSGLTSLNLLFLRDNKISDLYPLVENVGLGAHDLVDLRDNPLSDISISVYIPALVARGVLVGY